MACLGIIENIYEGEPIPDYKIEPGQIIHIVSPDLANKTKELCPDDKIVIKHDLCPGTWYLLTEAAFLKEI